MWSWCKPPNEPEHSRPILVLHFAELSATNLLLRHEDDVDAAELLALVPPEGLAQEPLRPVPLRRASHLSTGSEPYAAEPQAVLGRQEHEERAVQSQALSKNLPEVRRAPNALYGPKPCVRQPALLRTLRRDAAPPFLATPLEYEPAPLRAHPHEESMRPLALSIVWLKCTLHVDPRSERGHTALSRSS